MKAKEPQPPTRHNRRSRLLAALTAAVLCLSLGTAFHELVGHGLSGLIAGGRIASADILFLQVWPKFQIHGWRGYYGQCDVQDIPTHTGELLMTLAGSLSTLIASIIALALLHIHRWRSPWTSAALFAVGLWWIDLFTYTLPAWGLRRSILWGGHTAEPYDAAVALGMNARLFQFLALFVSAMLLGWWIQIARSSLRPTKTQTGSLTKLNRALG